MKTDELLNKILDEVDNIEPSLIKLINDHIEQQPTEKVKQCPQCGADVNITWFTTEKVVTEIDEINNSL